MSEENCETCRFWSRQVTKGCGYAIGLCRRDPPRLHPDGRTDDLSEVWIQGVWPATTMDAWCGEWQAKRVTLPVVTNEGEQV